MKRLLCIILCTILISGCNQPSPSGDLQLEVEPSSTPTTAPSALPIAPEPSPTETPTPQPNETPTVDPVTFNGKEVVSAYAVDTDVFVMAQLDSSIDDDRAALTSLEGYKPDGSCPDQLGFVVFTEGGREYIYLDGKNPELTEACRRSLETSELHPSWLIHMTTDKITSINGSTDKELIAKISDFLKQDVVVDAKTASMAGPVNPSTVAGIFHYNIKFDTGVSYNLIGYYYGDDKAGDFTLHASDVNTTISYACSGSVAKALKELVPAV